jgi:hypothetical protein
MIRVLFISLLVSVIWSCTNTDAVTGIDEDIYQGYKFLYDEGMNSTEVEATFRAGSKEGEVTILRPPAFLMINDEIWSVSDETSTFPYKVTYSSRMPMVIVDFEDFMARLFTQCFSLDSMVTLGDINLTLENDSSISVHFTEEHRCPNESFTMQITGGTVTREYDVEPDSANIITVDKDIVDEFRGELVKIILTRIKNIELKNVSTAGGDLQMIYVSKGEEIQL